MSYDGTQPRRVSMPKYNRLKQWAERRPIVALMGEFSAGKSTLMNFLIEEDLLPTRATATELPPVWLTHGERSAHWVDADGGVHPLDLAEIRKVPIDARFIRIHATAEILEHCDIIDTPGISDPNLAVDSWRYVAGQSNMVLWCSSATQAWRETERSAWLSLPERLRRNSLLVVTRADKLLTDIDRQKVSRRLARETGGLFARHVFVATHDAVQAKAELAQGIESRLWADSGAESLLDALAERFEAIYEQRSALLRRYEVEGQNQGQGQGTVQARRATDIRAEQSERMAQQAQRGPYVLEPGDRTDDRGAVPMPVRPVRPQSGTARPERPDPSARAEIIAKLRAGLGEDAPALPEFPSDAARADRDEGFEPFSAAAGPRDAEAEVAAAVVRLDFGRVEEAPVEVADMATEGFAGPADDPWDIGREDLGEPAPVPDMASDHELPGEAGEQAPAAPVLAEAFEDEPAELDPLTAQGFAGLPAEAEPAFADETAREGVEDALFEAGLRASLATGEPPEPFAGAAALHAGDAESDLPAPEVLRDAEHPAEPEAALDLAGAFEPVDAPDPVPVDAPDPALVAELTADAAADASGEDVRTAAAGHAEPEAPEEPAAVSVAAPSGILPPEVALWREVVARHPEAAAHAPVLAVIEAFLTELYGRRAPDTAATDPGEEAESGLPAWRRLA